LLLRYHDQITATSIECNQRALPAYHALYEALQQGVGLTLAEIEDLEVTE
jgi:hypothetical protein